MIPKILRSRLEAALRQSLRSGEGGPIVDFTQPEGEPALASADSVSWMIFNSPVSLLIGGITAVLLELAEPSVRSGVWDHTTFRSDPLKRMRRTGLAAMITVYGARSVAKRMIGGVRQMHKKVRGETPGGLSYEANDPDLLRWVHATAAFGFLEAYHAYVKSVSPEDRDRYYAEGAPIAQLYGAENAPVSETGLNELFQTMQPRLERSEIVFEFLHILRELPLLPRPLRFLNEIPIRAAIEILPTPIRQTLGLTDHPGLSRLNKKLLRFLARETERLALDSSPASQARQRLGSPRFPD